MAACCTDKPATPFLLSALKRLEYRGYDSYGLATQNPSGFHTFHSLDPINENPAWAKEIPDTVGIAHTRWATKGEVCLRNTHPIAGGRSEATTYVVHNGIIENYEELRSFLEKKNGYVFATETDTEVIAHLFDLSAREHWDNAHPVYSELDVFRAVLKRLKGQYAIALISTHQPDTVFMATHGAPLWVSPKGYVASDIAALAGYGDRAYRLADGEICIMVPDDIRVYDHDDSYSWVNLLKDTEIPAEAAKPREANDSEPSMMREIREQVALVLQEPHTTPLPNDFYESNRVFLFGCGSSYYAAVLGKHYVEDILERICYPLHSTDITESPLLERGFYVGLTQSGETKDTLNALKEITDFAPKIDAVVITNIWHSSAAKLAYETYLLEAGLEIGVAATKTFTMQAIRLLDLCNYTTGRKELSAAIEDVLNIDLEGVVNTISEYEHVLYLGRSMLYPIACEGALKMKEVAYKHAEALHAAEMKHGPIALIDEETLSIFLVTKDDEEQLQKILNNVDEIKARKGRIIAVCDEASEEAMRKRANQLVVVRNVDKYLQPILVNVVLQLLAFHVAVKAGCDPDRPRALAKCVTVE